MSRESTETARKEIEAVIHAFFEAGRNKDLSSIEDFHSSPATFSKFDEVPPYTRQDSEEAFVHEQAAFANISDYDYRVEEMRIDLMGDVAVASFYLTYKGMFINDYSFEGSPVGSRVRATMVMSKTPRGWRMMHEHLSRFPDWKEPKGSS